MNERTEFRVGKTLCYLDGDDVYRWSEKIGTVVREGGLYVGRDVLHTKVSESKYKTVAAIELVRDYEELADYET